MKTVFFGTPNIAIPFLEVLHKNSDIQLVITQPDKPRGRGMQISPCETKVKAQELGLEVAHKIPAQINAELGGAVAYGRLIKKETISQFKHGIINIHFSMLPKYRGASPVQYALLNGDTKTGVTAFFIDEGMDTGDIFLQKEIDISPEDTALTLFPKLIEAGTSILKECLAKIEQKNITRTKQTGESSNAPLINKEDYKLNFEQESAEKIHNKIRALGFGKAVADINDKPLNLKILKTSIAEDKIFQVSSTQKPSTIIFIERGLGFFVKCNSGVLLIEKLLPAGKKEISAYDFITGNQKKVGDTLFI